MLDLARRIKNKYLSWSGLVSFNSHYFYGAALNSGSIVVDLGANIGEFSYQVSSRFSCKCYAVEPSPSGYAQIKESRLVEKFNCAITDDRDIATLYISENPEVNSLYREISDSAVIQGVVKVEAITIEAFLAKNKIPPPDLLKVDIEGSELGLFKSISSATLCKIKQITVEFHDFIKGFNRLDEVRAIKKRLKSTGFFCIEFSRPYFSNADILFINKKESKISNLEWLNFYLIEYIILRFKYLVKKLKR